MFGVFFVQESFSLIQRSLIDVIVPWYGKLLFCCLSENYINGITSQLIIDALFYNINASPLRNIIVPTREVGENLRAAQ